MASTRDEEAELRVLNVINERLAKTPKHQIAQHVSPITQLLTSCKGIFDGSASLSKKAKSENAVAVHKFKTNLSSLLNDRSVEARWAAVILIKAALETGGWEMLKDCKSWVNGLIAILKKPDPPTTKKSSMITLTRIFMLTKDYPTLAREVTTPSLPAFITACLNHFQDKETGWAVQKSLYQRELLETMLEVFSMLIPRHPTIFRSFTTQIRAITILIISRNSSRAGDVGTPWIVPPSSQSIKIGQRVFVQLHLCAPKSGSAQEWNSTHEIVVRTIHETANEIFRAVLETWTTSSDMPRPTRSDATLPNDPGRNQSDALGNTAWLGLTAGAERMISLLGLLQQYFATPTSLPVTPRLGLICSLLTRLFLVTVPRAEDEIRFKGFELCNKQVSRLERMELFVNLPKIHAAAMGVIMHVVRRFGIGSMPMSSQFLDQLVWLFDAEDADLALRETTYSVLVDILKIIGPSLSSSKVSQMEKLIKRCSNDATISENIISSTERFTTTKPNTNGNTSTVNPNTVMETPAVRTSAATSYNSLQLAARTLISTMLSKLPAENIPQNMRDQLDLAAVSSRDANALTASALNPAPPQASILPIMASIHPDSLQVEAILRPRMPVIHTGAAASMAAGQTNGTTQNAPVPEADMEGAEVKERQADEPSKAPSQFLAAQETQDVEMAEEDEESSTSIEPFQLAAGPPDREVCEEPSLTAPDKLNLNPATNLDRPTKEVFQALNIEEPTRSTVATPDGLSALEAAIDAASSPERSTKPVEEHPAMSEKRTGKQKVVEAGAVEERDFAQPQETDIADSDDSDDFEIPKLVFRKDVGDEEDDEV